MNNETNISPSLDPFDLMEVEVSAHAINLFLALPTNGYVLWLIVNGVHGTLASEFFILNLTVIEIIFCFSAIPVFVLRHLESGCIRRLQNLLFGLHCAGQPLFQTCICLERYLAVVHPVVFLGYKPLRYRLACSAPVWMIIIGSCLFSVLVMRMNCALILNCVYMGLYLILFSVMLFCCLSVLRALKRPGPGEGERGREGSSNMKKRAFNIIRFTTMSAGMVYIPMIVSLFMYTLDPKLQEFLVPVLEGISVLSGVLQPLYYLHRAGRLPCRWRA